MGSRNKVLLASLVSVVMVMSFAVGLVPASVDNAITGAQAAAPAVAITADGATPVGDSLTLEVGESQSFSALGVDAAVEWSLATDDGSAELVDASGTATVVALAPGQAGLYLSSADGADLVNLTIVAAGEAKDLGGITILKPADQSTIYVQQGASNVPFAVSSATDDPADTGLVQYTLNGSVLGGSTIAPYVVKIADVTALGTSNTLVAAAATYAAYQASPSNPDFAFTATSTFSVVPGDFDPDGNGIPDFPFSLGLQPGDSWVSTAAGSTRQVVIVPLEDNFSKQATASAVPGTTATIADAENDGQSVSAFAPLGLIGEGEIGYLMLIVADTLEDLLDEGADGAISALPAGQTAPIAGAPFADVSILVSSDGGATFSEIADPLAGNVLVQFQGVAAGSGAEVKGFRFASDVTPPPVNLEAPATGAWQLVGSAIGDGVVTISTDALSVFAPFATPGAASITSVVNAEAGSALQGTPQTYATGGESLLVTVANVDAGASASITIDGQAAPITNTAATANGAVYTVTAPVAAPLAAPAPAKAVEVAIEVGGDADIAANAVSYVGPTVSGINPAVGPESGGTFVTISGDGFEPGVSVTIGGQTLTNLSVGATSITGSTTAADPGLVDVVVGYSNNYVGVLAGGFVYLPGPAEIAVTPNAVFDDGGYTVSVNAIMGTQFVDPATGVQNRVLFTDASGDPGDGVDPASDLPAAQVTFVDDTRLDILTPALDALTKQSGASTLLRLYATTSAYSPVASKQAGDQVSNLVDFVFVDAAAAAFRIEDINPSIGPAAGGNEVRLTGEFGDLEELDPGPVEPPTPTGHQVFFGQRFSGTVPVDVEFAPQAIAADAAQLPVTVYLSRADDAISSHPAAVSFDVTWDPSVITIGSPASVQATPLLGEWYGKQLALNFAQVSQGRLSVVISGGSTFTPDFQSVSTEVTTFNNQLPELTAEAGTDQQNPFPLFNITFNVVGEDGASTALAFDAGLTMADRNAAQLSDQGSLNTVVTVGPAEAKQAVGLGLFNLAFGNNPATVLQAGQISEDGTDRIDLIAPAVDAAAAAANFEAELPFSVDVRVESVDFDPFATDGSETLFAISRAASIYTSDKSISGGYTYLPGPTRQITGLSPTQAWIFGAEQVTIEGQGFIEATKNDPIVTFELTDDEGETVVLQAELVSVSDTEIVVVAPVLEADVSGRTIGTNVVVEFGDSVKSTETAGVFTYVKWDVAEVSSGASLFDGAPVSGDVTTNSFFFNASEGFDAGEAGLVFDGAAELAAIKASTNPIIGEIVPPSSTTGTLRIPPLPAAVTAAKTTDRVFGILRVTQVEELFGIGELADNASEDAVPFPGNSFSTIFNFDLHLYEGTAPYDEFYVRYDTEDLPDVPSLVYEVPASVGLTRAEIATGTVATWSRPTTFDFEFATRTSSIPEIAEGEKADRLVAPRPNTYSLEALLITEDTLPSNTVEQPTAVRARLFNLGAGSFALRRDAAPPLGSITARTATGSDITVTPGGGDEVRIAGRNIYWATNLFAVPTGGAPATTNPFGAPVSRSTNPTTGIETLVFIAPPLAEGTYDLYLSIPSSGSKQTNLVPVTQGRLIVRGGFPFPGLIGLIPALLGTGLALIGLLAGGDSSSSGGPCFIATAAYGTPMAAEIDTLRVIRDSYLLSNPLGAAFVDGYYRVSPAIADVVAQSPVLAAVVRLLLTPVLFAGKMLVTMPGVGFGLLSLGFAMAMLRRRFSRGL